MSYGARDELDMTIGQANEAMLIDSQATKKMLVEFQAGCLVVLLAPGFHVTIAPRYQNQRGKPSIHTLLDLPTRIATQWEGQNLSQHQVPKSNATEWLAKVKTMPLVLSRSIRDAPYVHPKAISFSCVGERRDWEASEAMPDAPTRDTFSSFYDARKDGKKTWIGLFSVPTGQLIGNLWKDAKWHAYAVAIISNPAGGKIAVLWDCDPVNVTEGSRAKDVLWGKQRTFLGYKAPTKTSYP
ncbi:hypothetical protein EKO27_g7297 [Xylaria grammica]|uniref:Uncharacterized protein n=1 Tax=Xylaria grammica TaxID=363999 RepID=A0A439D035_9PEZI|nr:hypothetical protein EKO27_g7297 [Xylaria grammica]